MRSVLSPDLEEKRLTVASAHNMIAFLGGVPLIVAMFVGLFNQIRKIPGHENDVGFAISNLLLPIFMPVAIGLALLIVLQGWNDRRVCRQVGFACNHCGHLLYPSNAFATGICPSCGEKLTSRPLFLTG